MASDPFPVNCPGCEDPASNATVPDDERQVPVTFPNCDRMFIALSVNASHPDMPPPPRRGLRPGPPGAR